MSSNTASSGNESIALSMADAPRIRQMAVAVHGQRKIERFQYLNFWSLHAYHYHARLRVGDAWHDIVPGTISLLPPAVELEFHFSGQSRHIYIHFDPAPGKTDRHLFRLTYPPSDPFAKFESDMREAVGWFPRETNRTRARVWDLLWRLTGTTQQVPAGQTAGIHPVLAEALSLVETNLPFSVTVASLAESLDISRAHLVRLFRQHLKMSPLQYILTRRAERAEHLLRHTTQPIKAIAREVGIRDLQQFNKLIRTRLGKSPRQLRT